MAILLPGKPENYKDFIRLSVSKYKTFDSCKKKFHFSYIEKLPQGETTYLDFGHLCHYALETFHKAYINGCSKPFHEVMCESFKEARCHKDWKDRISSEQVNEAGQILTIYLQQLAESEKNKTIPQFISAEQDFWVQINDNILVSGFIDRVQIDPDGVLCVADYKTNKKVIDPKKDHLKKDLFQLKTYGWVMCLMNPELEKVRCSYIMLKDNMRMITQEFEKEELMEMESVFLEKAKLMDAEKAFKANPTILCDWCPYMGNPCIDGEQFLIKIGRKQTKSNPGQVIEWSDV